MLDDEAAPLNFDRQEQLKKEREEKRGYHELLKRNVSF